MEPENRVLASSSGSISVSLHPLVIMNISDHYTRSRMQGGSTTTKGVRIVCVIHSVVDQLQIVHVHVHI